MKILINILISLVAISIVDGCLYRDPGVTLSHGYSIVAISASSPCWLQYSPEDDDRAYSDYVAIRSVDSSTNVPSFSLVSQSEVLNFNSEDDWLLAIQQHNAAPDPSSLQLEDVRSFAADSRHIIGTYGGGQFVLDISSNSLLTYANESKWSSIVDRDTDLSSKTLRDPKSFLAQSRHLFVIIGYAAFLLAAVALGWLNRGGRSDEQWNSNDINGSADEPSV